MKKIVQLAVLLSLSTFFTKCIGASDNYKIKKNISFFIQHINAKNFADGEGETTSSEKPFAVTHPFFVKTVSDVLSKKQNEDNEQEGNAWSQFDWHNDEHVKKLKEEVKSSLEVFFYDNEAPTNIRDVIGESDEIILSYLEITDMESYKLIDALISASKSSDAIPVPLPLVIPPFIVGAFIASYNPLKWFKKKKESETSSKTTEGEETYFDPEE